MVYPRLSTFSFFKAQNGVCFSLLHYDFNRVRALQHECSHEIYQKASYILPKYWEVDEDSSDNVGGNLD